MNEVGSRAASQRRENLLTIARIKAEAATNNVSSVELSAQRLILHRNGSPILLDGSRFPSMGSVLAFSHRKFPGNMRGIQ